MNLNILPTQYASHQDKKKVLNLYQKKKAMVKVQYAVRSVGNAGSFPQIWSQINFNGPNKDCVVPHSCRATIRNGMSKRSLFYLFLKFVYINFIFSDNIRTSRSYNTAYTYQTPKHQKYTHEHHQLLIKKEASDAPKRTA
jgi:hypothetical protein